MMYTKILQQKRQEFYLATLIVKVNALDVTSTTYQEALEALKTGDIGTTVNLTVRRNNQDIGMEVTRQKLTITSVHSRLISDTVGYIQITEFNDATVAQFQQAINDMQSIGAQSLILTCAATEAVL